jgi:hypothetical protein
MTVAELIEALQQLPGDPSLRPVVVAVQIGRPYIDGDDLSGRIDRVDLYGNGVRLWASSIVD